MPSTQRHQPAKPQSQSLTSNSPNPKASAKYTNKDGSKFINLPTNAAAMPQVTAATNGQPSPDNNGEAPAVNRKKQRRRQKESEKRDRKLAEDRAVPDQAHESRPEDQLGSQLQNLGLGDKDTNQGEFSESEDGEPYQVSFSQKQSDTAFAPRGHDQTGHDYHYHEEPVGKKSKKKKKGKKSQEAEVLQHLQHHANGASQLNTRSQYPLSHPSPTTTGSRGPGISKEKIWNTSSNEERERIKAFWLSLGEEERKSLVKVEKDAVLKKMKEQQRNSCACVVCGRKRVAIEEELEVLYDAYYEELEQYAHHQGDGGPPMMPPPRRFGAIGGLQPPNRVPPSAFNGQYPSRGRIIQSEDDDDGEDDEEDSERNEGDEEDEDYDSEEELEPEPVPELPRTYETDFFNFGQSLTVKGGILTVADDLLKNDGKKFIEMMEQLAERRMQRENDAEHAQSYANYGPPQGMQSHAHSHGYHHGHNHGHSHPHQHPPPHHHPHPPPPPDDEEYDEEEEDEDEEYDDSEDPDYDDEEGDPMTEEQRMEEGRRMFQIFAARMFEQRVLTAYKEKVAKERQEKLMEEEDEDKRAEEERKAKKAKDAQKKKEKAAQKKRLIAEKKAQDEAEKAAEEAALRAAEEKRVEEQRLKAEEKRRKKEVQKKAEEEERLKKEAEKQRRDQERRDRQAEAERKAREAKEKERLQKEEARQKEKEIKDAKEREVKERKEKQEREKREKEAKEKQQRENLAAQQAATRSAAVAASQAVKRPPVPIPANLQSQPLAVSSPQIPVATPALPKAPTPIKVRTSSQQDSSTSGSSVPHTPKTAGVSSNVSPVPSTPLQGSPGPAGLTAKQQNFVPLFDPQPSSPLQSSFNGPPLLRNSFAGLQSPVMSNGMPMMPPGFGPRPGEPFSLQQPFRPPIPFPAGMNPNGLGMLPIQQGLQGARPPFPQPPPGYPHMPNGLGVLGMNNGIGGMGQGFGNGPTHTRQSSAGGFDNIGSPAQPIARPGPVGRPASVVHGQRHDERQHNDFDGPSKRLGSSALLDGTDEPLGQPPSIPRSNAPPGVGVLGGIGSLGGFSSSIPANFNTWGQGPFGASSLPGSSYIGSGGWPQSSNSSFGNNSASSAMRPSQPRPVWVRVKICQTCRDLESSTSDGFIPLDSIKDQLINYTPIAENPISEAEILDLCETEGNQTNGGGSFSVRVDHSGRQYIRHELHTPTQRPLGAPGQIGSPSARLF